MSDDGSYQDITSVIIDNAAYFISKNGLEFEKEFLTLHNNERFYFLNSFDPLHGIYKQKLTEYQNKAHDDAYDYDHNDNDDDDVANTSSEIIETTSRFYQNSCGGNSILCFQIWFGRGEGDQGL